MTALAPIAAAADSKSSRKKSSISESSSRKKGSTAKKSTKSRKPATQSAKSKSKAAKRERAPIVVNDWIELLPEVELPTESGPPEDELLETVQESDQP